MNSYLPIICWHGFICGISVAVCMKYDDQWGAWFAWATMWYAAAAVRRYWKEFEETKAEVNQPVAK